MLALRLQTFSTTEKITQALVCTSQRYPSITLKDLLPLPSPTLLHGPTRVAYLTHPSRSIQVMVIGELHEDYERCSTSAWSLPSFLQTIVEEREVDFFLELSYVNHQHPTRKAVKKGSKIRKIYQRFRKCFQLEKEDCPYTSRFHYVDLRKSVPLIQRCNQAYYQMMNRIEGEDVTDENFLEGITLDRILRETKIGKQLEKTDPLVGKRLRKMITSSFTLFRYQYLKVMKLGRISEDELIDFAMLCVDVYTLARMFRRFNKGVGRIITYTGDLHSQRYISFLKELGFSLDFHREIDYEDKQKCIDISSLVPILFNN